MSKLISLLNLKTDKLKTDKLYHIPDSSFPSLVICYKITLFIVAAVLRFLMHCFIYYFFFWGGGGGGLFSSFFFIFCCCYFE